jgi:hypothetical protein
VDKNKQPKKIWGMSQIEGEWYRVQRDESFKESLKEWEESNVWPNRGLELENIYFSG